MAFGKSQRAEWNFFSLKVNYTIPTVVSESRSDHDLLKVLLTLENKPGSSLVSELGPDQLGDGRCDD